MFDNEDNNYYILFPELEEFVDPRVLHIGQSNDVNDSINMEANSRENPNINTAIHNKKKLSNYLISRLEKYLTLDQIEEISNTRLGNLVLNWFADNLPKLLSKGFSLDQIVILTKSNISDKTLECMINFSQKLLENNLSHSNYM